MDGFNGRSNITLNLIKSTTLPFFTLGPMNKTHYSLIKSRKRLNRRLTYTFTGAAYPKVWKAEIFNFW